MAAPQMTIAGRRVGEPTLGVLDPATETEFARVPDCTGDQLDEAFAAARQAGSAWAADEDDRLAALHRMADSLEANIDEISDLLTSEQGKPLRAARYEVSETARWIRSAAAVDLPRKTIVDDADKRIDLVHRPLGVVAAITPWNFPLLLTGWKLGPALRAGNTVVLKPSPYTPVSTLRVGEILNEVLPAGVLNVVSGGDGLGAEMTTHPDVRKISFTGSVATGKAVAKAAADDLKRVTLELGGNDAAIVLDDADPAKIARGLFWGAFVNCGQICAGIKRVYVPESLRDQVVDVLADLAKSVRVGPGKADGTQIGPLQNRQQYERVLGLIDDARARGAQFAAGGSRIDQPGYFIEPTVVTGIAEGARLVDEEQFGPALPIMSYKTVDEAIERANTSKFGLSGSIWSSDLDRAAAVAERLDCGTAFVNDHLALSPDVPFGGVKWSGIGVENGQWGLEEFTTLQVISRPKA